MISCAFPPTGGPGVQRSAYFARHLPEYGWRPFVWCAEGLEQLPRDESLSAIVPKDVVVRARRGSSYAGAHARWMKRLWKSGLPVVVGERGLDAISWRVLALFRLLSATIIPDDQVVWALRSAVPLLRFARENDVEAILSTFSPVSNHLLGLWLNTLTGVPWVADFRDLWTDDYSYPNRRRWRRMLDRALEQRILERADAVISVSEGQKRTLARHLPGQPRKFSCITNGVDLSEFNRRDPSVARAELHGPKEDFVLTFTGWFLSNRVDPALIDGIGRFAASLGDAASRFVFRIVGSIGDELAEQFTRAGLRLESIGYQTHDRATDYMMASDALLLLTPCGPAGRAFITGKLFEYLASGRPIVHVGSVGGEVDRLVRQYNAGLTVPPESEAVRAVLREFWRAWKSGNPRRGCSRHCITRFDRRVLAGQLARLLDELASRSGRVPRG